MHSGSLNISNVFKSEVPRIESNISDRSNNFFDLDKPQLMQPRTAFACFAAASLCWLLFSFRCTRTPDVSHLYFCLVSSSSSILCLLLLLSKYRTYLVVCQIDIHFFWVLLNFDHSKVLNGALQSKSQPQLTFCPFIMQTVLHILLRLCCVPLILLGRH